MFMSVCLNRIAKQKMGSFACPQAKEGIITSVADTRYCPGWRRCATQINATVVPVGNVSLEIQVVFSVAKVAPDPVFPQSRDM